MTSRNCRGLTRWCRGKRINWSGSGIDDCFRIIVADLNAHHSLMSMGSCLIQYLSTLTITMTGFLNIKNNWRMMIKNSKIWIAFSWMLDETLSNSELNDEILELRNKSFTLIFTDKNHRLKFCLLNYIINFRAFFQGQELNNFFFE